MASSGVYLLSLVIYFLVLQQSLTLQILIPTDDPTQLSLKITADIVGQFLLQNTEYNRARRQSAFPTFISCQRQDANVLPKRRQSHQGDKLCDVSTVPLVARWPVFLARGSDADGELH